MWLSVIKLTAPAVIVLEVQWLAKVWPKKTTKKPKTFFKFIFD